MTPPIPGAVLPLPESLAGFPVPVLALAVLAALGWLLVLAGLRRGLRDEGRGPALLLHTLTPPGLVGAFAFVGHGTLHAVVAVTACWWALVGVTGLSPARLLADGTLPRLALWLALALALTLLGSRLVGLL